MIKPSSIIVSHSVLSISSIDNDVAVLNTTLSIYTSGVDYGAARTMADRMTKEQYRQAGWRDRPLGRLGRYGLALPLQPRRRGILSSSKFDDGCADDQSREEGLHHGLSYKQASKRTSLRTKAFLIGDLVSADNIQCCPSTESHSEDCSPLDFIGIASRESGKLDKKTIVQ